MQFAKFNIHNRARINAQRCHSNVACFGSEFRESTRDENMTWSCHLLNRLSSDGTSQDEISVLYELHGSESNMFLVLTGQIADGGTIAGRRAFNVQILVFIILIYPQSRSTITTYFMRVMGYPRLMKSAWKPFRSRQTPESKIFRWSMNFEGEKRQPSTWLMHCEHSESEKNRYTTSGNSNRV